MKIPTPGRLTCPGLSQNRDYQIHHVPVDGERCPVLLRHGYPLVMPNLWARYLRASMRPNSVRSYLQDLITLLTWADRNKIPIDERLRSFRGFRHHEISKLEEAVATKMSGDEAAPATSNRRLAAFVHYVRFCFEFHIDLTFPDYLKVAVGLKMMDATSRQLRALMEDEGTVAACSKPSQVLSQQQLAVIDEILQPTSIHNPFATRLVRERNYCLLRIALATWARRSELVLISLGDIDLGPMPAITIKEPSKQSKNRRRDGASMKTRGRKIPLDRRDAELLANYLRETRPTFVRSKSPSTELFLSKKDGKRLSAKTINGLLGAAAKAIRDHELCELSRLHPHALRKQGAESFRRVHGPTSNDHQALIANMAYKAGWSNLSRMPEHYTREAMSDELGRRVRHVDIGAKIR